MPDTTTSSTYDPTVTRKWVERLERFAASKQTVAAFCAAEGVFTANFYLWRRRLAQHTPTTAARTPTVAPIRVPAGGVAGVVRVG